MANNRGIEINDDGSYSIVKQRKSKREYVIVEQTVTAKDRHSAKCKFRALNCADLDNA
jgi:hypothetical protein